MAEAAISTAILARGRGDDLALEQGLHMIATAGYRLIELSQKHAKWSPHGETIGRLELRVWAVHGCLGAAAADLDKARRDEVLDSEFTCLEDAAAYAPCPYVVHYLYRHRDPRIGEVYRESIGRLLARCRALGLRLAVETAPYKPRINERYPDSKEIAGFVRSFGSDDISVCIDLNHSNLREDLPQVARNCRGLISTIHVSDNLGEREDHLPPGEGTIDFPRAIAALREAGYEGPVNLECCPAGEVTLEILIRLREWAESISDE